MTIEDIEKEIIDEFADLDEWMDRYALIIDMGNQLAPFEESLKTPDRLIEGCQSRVWLDGKLTPEGTVEFQADSDAIIVKGIIALLLRVFNGHTPSEILDAKLEFIDKIGLNSHLSPTRANGLVSMLKQIRAYATAFQLKKDNK